MKSIFATSSKAQSPRVFTLIPFSAPNIPAITITGTVTRQSNQLSIQYSVHGEIENIRLPELSKPARKHDLWKATCFEFFIAIQNQPQYWEFNLSPSSAWNVYAMDAYRQVNMREELAFAALPFEFKKTNDELALNISTNLNSIIEHQNIQLGITTIIQTLDGNETYWAFAHPSPQADFHLRKSFVIEI